MEVSISQITLNVTTSNPISHINNLSEWRSFDVSEMGAGDDREDAEDDDDEDEIKYKGDNIINGKNHKITWPTTRKGCRP
eukprot:8068596-Ditylum_brightwellii.AAC.1